MENSNNFPSKGDKIPHSKYYEIAGGTIPFNLATTDLKSGEPRIRCPRCDKTAQEEKFEWVDSDVSVLSVGEAGTILNHDVQSIVLECPNCNKQFYAY